MPLPDAALIGGLAVDVKIFADDADAGRGCGETSKGEAQKKDGFHGDKRRDGCFKNVPRALLSQAYRNQSGYRLPVGIRNLMLRWARLG